MRLRKSGGFTLVELLVSVGVIAILVGLCAGAVKGGLDNGAMVREMSAAKSLMTAYTTYAADNNGEVLPGVKTKGPGDPPIVDRHGVEVTNQSLARRWPFRLAPYFDHEYGGSIVVNQMFREYRKMQGKRLSNLDGDEYVASACPSFGLNSTFMGGNFVVTGDEPLATDTQYGNYYVSRAAQVAKPGQMIVFVSARSSSGGNLTTTFGNLYVFAPRTTGGMRWSSEFQESGSSDQFGNVHPRWNHKAVVAQFDGSVVLLGEDELKDMRRWSNQAAEANDPNWSLKTQ